MNTLEREQLSRFLEELTMARVSIKDPEAEKLVQEACVRQVDAPYLLVQRCLVLDQALQNAQAENARLQNAHGTGGSFLNANAWGASATGQAPTSRPASNYAPPVPAAPAAGASWGSGMLGGVATTAAGVVAGALLYQGVGHLMGNRGGSSVGANEATPLAEKSPESLMPNQSDLAAGDFDSIIPSDDDLGSMG